MTSLTSGRYSKSYRVYIEDTDAGGIVYYVNYLKFMERTRTDALRSLGVEQSSLIDQFQMMFVVKCVNVEYFKPARLDDVIVSSLSIVKMSGSSLTFEQTIQNESGEVLSSGSVVIVCVGLSIKPKRMPVEFKKMITPLISI